MAKCICKDYEKDKNIVVFPFAIAWMDRSPLFVKHISRLEVHFLWWYWGWSFERREKDGK